MITSTQRSLLASYDGEFLLAALDALGTVGLIPGAGLQRMAYGAADMEGRRWIMGEMQTLGMAASIALTMIFVPSEAGISHAPEEFTQASHCIDGGRVLLATLLELDTQI